jgi:methanogenic corrinoid protein MtbC1
MDREAGVTSRDAFGAPRLLLSRRGPRPEFAGAYGAPAVGLPPNPGPPGAPGVSGPTPTPDERDRYLELVLGADDLAAAAFVDELLARGVDVGGIYLGLLAPTAERLGQMWDEDTCDFFDVTVATGRLQRAVRELGRDFVGGADSDDRFGRMLLSAMPGEQHTLGLFMVAEYLLRDGWGVRVTTPATSAELAGVLRDHAFDVVGFSVACNSRLLALRHEIAAVRRHSRNPNVCIIVGGRIFVEHPELVGRVGADGFAPSAADASRCARALVGARLG